MPSKTIVDQMTTTIAASHADLVVVATPIDLAGLIPIRKPVVRAHYQFVEDPAGPLSAVIDAFLQGRPVA